MDVKSVRPAWVGLLVDIAAIVAAVVLVGIHAVDGREALGWIAFVQSGRLFVWATVYLRRHKPGQYLHQNISERAHLATHADAPTQSHDPIGGSNNPLPNGATLGQKRVEQPPAPIQSDSGLLLLLLAVGGVVHRLLSAHSVPHS